jgi:hypothetical protein
MMTYPVPPRFLTDSDPGDETPVPCIHLDVVCWRFDCLVRAGYPDDMAITLAERGDVDLHDAVELLNRGATVHDAIRILT